MFGNRPSLAEDYNLEFQIYGRSPVAGKKYNQCGCLAHELIGKGGWCIGKERNDRIQWLKYQFWGYLKMMQVDNWRMVIFSIKKFVLFEITIKL